MLQNDVTSEGTCFDVDADGVSLDLNGHTVTYAINAQGKVRFGVSGIACFDPDLRPGAQAAGAPCGDHASHLTVFNGTITQGPEAASFSHAIRIGQNNDAGYLTVHDVTFNIHSPGTMAVYTVYAGGEAIYDNVVNSSVREIENRHQLQGMAVKFGSSETTSKQQVYGNKIRGGAQGGVFSAGSGTTVHDNDIAQDGRYWNDFAIYAWGNGMTVFGNDIHPSNGRGIQIAGGAVNVNGDQRGATGVQVHDNTISVQEQAVTLNNKTDAPGCEIGGAFGIQFDDSPERSSAYHNTVVARSDQCDAAALRLTDTGPGNDSHDNIYRCERTRTSTRVCAGVSFSGAQDHSAPFVSMRDTFIGDTASVAVWWDGAQGFTCIGCTFGSGPDPSGYVTFSFQNGGAPNEDMHIRDATFTGNASKDSTDLRSQDENHKYAGYFIEWTYELKVENPAGKPIGGAAVKIQDAANKTIFSGLTDASGHVSTVLSEFHRFNYPHGTTRTALTPDVVTVNAPGCASETHSVAADKRITQVVHLNCP